MWLSDLFGHEMCLLVGGVAVSMGRCHLIGCYDRGGVVVGWETGR